MAKISLNRTWGLGKEFDRGGFGKIHLGSSDAGEEVVIKLIPKDPGADRELLFESVSGRPNVIPILDAGEWNDFWVLVMPKAEKSLRAFLNEYVAPPPIDESVAILIDLATALCGLEDVVVHRDLKPENILLFEGKWCLTDFGIARYAEATTAVDTRKYALSPPYAAPEQWRMERATRATDVYALGVIAFEMLSGGRPFSGPADHEYREQHLNTNPPVVSGCPPLLSSLISECLYKAVQARPSPDNILARLQANVGPSSSAAKALQNANQSVTESNAEKDAQLSAARSHGEVRTNLFEAGVEGLNRILDQMHDAIRANAPAAQINGHTFSLSDAELRIHGIGRTSKRSFNRFDPSIDVIAHTSVVLKIPADRHGYEGRSHSLWYCDAQEEGVYRWYETAFMMMPMIPRQSSLAPFALNPDEDAYGALSGVMSEFQVAWPFTAIDQGQENQFIEVWMGRFATAALGNLRRPNRLPEGEPQGSWRK